MSTAVESQATPAEALLNKLANVLLPNARQHLLQGIKNGPGHAITNITACINNELVLLLTCPNDTDYIWVIIKQRNQVLVQKMMTHDDVCLLLELFAEQALAAVSVLDNDQHYNGGLDDDGQQLLMQGRQRAQAWGKILAQVKALQQLYTPAP